LRRERNFPVFQETSRVFHTQDFGNFFNGGRRGEGQVRDFLLGGNTEGSYFPHSSSQERQGKGEKEGEKEREREKERDERKIVYLPFRSSKPGVTMSEPNPPSTSQRVSNPSSNPLHLAPQLFGGMTSRGIFSANKLVSPSTPPGPHSTPQRASTPQHGYLGTTTGSKEGRTETKIEKIDENKNKNNEKSQTDENKKTKEMDRRKQRIWREKRRKERSKPYSKTTTKF